jgi:hypothetical protein
MEVALPVAGDLRRRSSNAMEAELMAWTAPMIHALLLRTPAPAAAKPLRVVASNRPMRGPSPRGVSAETSSGYGKG